MIDILLFQRAPREYFYGLFNNSERLVLILEHRLEIAFSHDQAHDLGSLLTY